ncbi:MAG: copper amine oxidase-like protein [Parcubacteria group bacterium Gr01-1014_18]|nr:MAG: copper amine oxidase-like protein [Parcubacteria group bacterium Greene0416_36]TSC81056.1 MAG: copper amine oxidase-like protein [Parcubacteria group bacterium Gr01-1014_18]TSC98790.1 MAG: copper amine oxidase-like protein [Parcubacteria group bacterium Greene1014_20]TSD06730.1 MAG: copper amine oxidase-like protein [Parcubacteria group bacterium Greene0714_2]
MQNDQKLLAGLLAVGVLGVILAGYFLSMDNAGTKGPWVSDSGKISNGKVDIATGLKNQSVAKKFKNYDELRDFLDEKISVGSSGFYGRGGMERIFSMDSMAESSGPVAANKSATVGQAAPAPSDAEDGDYSTTNVQVEGVDEADIIKNDGKYIYALSGNNLFIIDAYPAEGAKILSKIEFKSYPQDIYIHGDRLVVFGVNNEIYSTQTRMIAPRGTSYTFVKIFDISLRQSPKQIRTWDLEGNYYSSRMIGDHIYMVLSQYYYPLLDGPVPLPRILEDEQELSFDPQVKGCNCPDMFYFDIPYHQPQFTSIISIPVVSDSESIDSDVYLLDNTQNMYVSENNLYLAYTKYLNEYELEMEVWREVIYPKLSGKSKTRVDEIAATSDGILSPEEKRQKVFAIVERHRMSLPESEQIILFEEVDRRMKVKYADIQKELEKTVIHKVAIGGGKVEYSGVGEVSGYVLNQFSMDEYNGYFRIATTRSPQWRQWQDQGVEFQSYSNMYVLDSNMSVVGSVEKLAPDEQIYSVRFMGDRAYMVTFKRTDPLFALDLSDPRNPKVLGKLKIPGFSNYLHPWGKDYLIGFGKDAQEGELGGVKTGGLKLSLFDVRNITNPREVDNLILGDSGSYSEALSDHKAFLFSPEKKLIVVPVSIYEKMGANQWGNMTFQGAVAVDISELGLTLKGKVTHPKISNFFPGPIPMGVMEKRMIMPDYVQNPAIRRSLYIENTLYTFSDSHLQLNSISDLSTQKTIRLEKEKEDDFEVIP